MAKPRTYKYSCGIEITIIPQKDGTKQWVFDASMFGFPMAMYGNYDDVMFTKNPKKAKDFFALARMLNSRASYVNGMLG